MQDKKMYLVITVCLIVIIFLQIMTMTLIMYIYRVEHNIPGSEPVFPVLPYGNDSISLKEPYRVKTFAYDFRQDFEIVCVLRNSKWVFAGVRPVNKAIMLNQMLHNITCE